MQEVNIPQTNYWIAQDILKEQDIIKINNYIESNFDFYEPNDKFDSKKKYSNVKCISYEKIKNFLKPFIETIEECNSEMVGWDINPPSSYDVGSLNIYNPNNGGEYKWHNDSSNTLTDIKYTLLINLSTQKYEGGKFQLFNGGELDIPQIDIPGGAIWFKSYVNHRVLPVTKGERRTLAFFILGPKFK